MIIKQAFLMRDHLRRPPTGTGVLALITILLLIFASPAHAHNTSITWIDVKVAESHLALTLTLNLNQSDLLEHVLNASASQSRFTDRRELEDAAPKVLAYVRKNLHVSADGKPLGTPVAQGWPPMHAELTHLDANGLETPSVIPLKLDYVLPGKARHIEIRPDMFAAPNFTAIFDVSISTHADAKPSLTVVDQHQPIAFDLGESSNVGATKPGPAPPKYGPGFWVTINVLLAAAVVTVWWWRRTRRSR